MTATGKAEQKATLPLTGLADLADCCRPVGGRSVLDAAAAARLAGTLKALAEPARLRLLSIISASAPDAVCVCELIEPVGLAQPTVSHHLKVLVEAGMVTREQRGKWAYYAVVPDALAAVAAAIHPG